MTVKISDLMATTVITAEPHHSVDHVRRLMERNRIHAVPVIGPAGEPVGFVSSADLVSDLKGGTPIKNVMTYGVHTVPAYNDVHIAARIMRNKRIHHVVVTHEKKVVGIISSFDLLKLVEEHRYVAKPAPRTSRRKSNSRAEA